MDVITIEGGVPPVQPAEIRVEAMSLERLLRDEHPEGMLDADWRRLRSDCKAFRYRLANVFTMTREQRPTPVGSRVRST